MGHEIGYRKPPPDKQFKKGTSGNPKGRPKGSKSFVTLLQDELAAPVVLNENGKKRTITRKQAMVKKLVTGALGGDPKAFLLLIDVMRRTGQLDDAVEQESLVPEDFAAVVDAYVAQQQKK